MEIIDPEQKKIYESREVVQSRNYDPKGRILGGFIVILIGGILLAGKMGVYFPDWLMSWQMLLIAIGIFIGAKQSFRLGGWLVPVTIGIFFLLSEWMPFWNLRPYFWPVVLIAVGMIMIFTPGIKFMRSNTSKKNSVEPFNSSEEVIDSVSIFGGNKKNIISKNFKGGESVCIFGGSEINLSQADIEGTVQLEIVQIFGGTKLILPPHWDVKSEMVSILGGIEDTRIGQKENINSTKVLVIKGVTVLGGISIKSF